MKLEGGEGGFIVQLEFAMSKGLSIPKEFEGNRLGEGICMSAVVIRFCAFCCVADLVGR